MRISLITIAMLVVLGLPMRLRAETVRFDDATREAADFHQIGVVRASSHQLPTVFQPATMMGQGLGVAGPVGASHTFDQQLLYLAGEDFASTTLREDRIHFCFNPNNALTFTSMTVVPYLTITGSGGPYVELPTYGFSLFVGLPFTGGGGITLPASAFGSATVIELPYQAFLNNGQSIDSLEVYLSTGMGGERDEGIFFSEYRNQHLGEAQTIQFGFTIVSLGYQPIPEPSAFALVGFGTIFLMIFMRRK